MHILYTEYPFPFCFSSSNSLLPHFTLAFTQEVFHLCWIPRRPNFIQIFVGFCLWFSFSFLMLKTLYHWSCNQRRKMGPVFFVKVTFIIELMIMYPFFSLGRCASWILLLFPDEWALQQSAPPAFVQNAVLLWQWPMLVFWCSWCSWNVSDQIHWYESTCILSVIEHWIRQPFSFISNIFVTGSHTTVEARRHIERLFYPAPLLKAWSPMAGMPIG